MLVDPFDKKVRIAVLVFFFLLDIDECTFGLHDCPFNTNCVNTLGSYTCKCASGFMYNDSRCYGESVEKWGDQ